MRARAVARLGGVDDLVDCPPREVQRHRRQPSPVPRHLRRRVQRVPLDRSHLRPGDERVPAAATVLGAGGPPAAVARVRDHDGRRRRRHGLRPRLPGARGELGQGGVGIPRAGLRAERRVRRRRARGRRAVRERAPGDVFGPAKFWCYIDAGTREGVICNVVFNTVPVATAFVACAFCYGMVWRKITKHSRRMRDAAAAGPSSSAPDKPRKAAAGATPEARGPDDDDDDDNDAGTRGIAKTASLTGGGAPPDAGAVRARRNRPVVKMMACLGAHTHATPPSPPSSSSLSHLSPPPHTHTRTRHPHHTPRSPVALFFFFFAGNGEGRESEVLDACFVSFFSIKKIRRDLLHFPVRGRAGGRAGGGDGSARRASSPAGYFVRWFVAVVLALATLTGNHDSTFLYVGTIATVNAGGVIHAVGYWCSTGPDERPARSPSTTPSRKGGSVLSHPISVNPHGTVDGRCGGR
ncbi:MAG: hypothetical protein BJ554DRAFT_2642 [Olpidium bornovanus]|uniref:Uncharacterized protein n=1 Tax=Olpidium bornovanus TaxID=278681 RepID=A0A8H8A2B2_9FUNG|nr:MAG: hypothetical protein BJ554DRAFT_2642 [Olpidium bornovanus]